MVAPFMADIQFILDAVRKDKRSNLFMGPVIVAFGVILGFVPVDDHGPILTIVYVVGKWLITAAFVVGGIYAFVDLLGPPEKDEGVKILASTPEKIVWAHVLVRTKLGQRISAQLVLGTEDGERVRVAIPLPEEDSERALAVVREVAPGATIGFSPDAESQFVKDPRSMRTS